MGKTSFRTSLAILAGLVFSFVPQVFAADFPFSDVAASDPIYADLKKLYERGVVDAPADGKFHQEALMDRDEFVSIAVGVGCRKCLTPTIPDVLKYREIPFLDFEKKSPYFYCVSYAKEKSIVFGYSIPGASSYTCQDSKPWDGVPFCAKNRTSRIEAAAMLLRQAGLWDDVVNSTGFERKRTFKDVDPYWYGYAQKGADVGILTPDSDGTLRPNEYVTKREFVKMAAIIYSLNMCDAKGMSGDFSASSATDSKDSVSSEIRVLDSSASCSASAKPAALTNPSVTDYNFYGLPTAEASTYSWEFLPADGSGTSVKAEGQCLSKYSLPAGRWIAKLRITDASGRVSTSYAEVPFGPASKTPLSLSVGANPLSVPAGTFTEFSSIAAGGKGPYEFRWDLGDGTVTTLSDPKHAYESAGTYSATLVVTDSEGSRAIAKVVVEVTDNPDLDADGVLNAADSCPRVFGPASNKGCPPVTEYAAGAASGIFGAGWAVLTLEGVGGKCLYSYAAPKGAVFGKASCDSCPCAYDVDFLSDARRCDILFPAILSPDKKTVYGRGALFEMR